jgi:hypothetical protein
VGVEDIQLTETLDLADMAGVVRNTIDALSKALAVVAP